jgi:hypothetical protein
MAVLQEKAARKKKKLRLGGGKVPGRTPELRHDPLG